jgi:hypothetical protein
VDEFAFPHVNFVGQKITGMTLRDYFAARAMQGMMARDVFDGGQARPEQRAKLAYIEADAMLQARVPEPLPPVKVSTIWNKCTVCGLEGVSGVVCYHPQCPTRMTCT